jgi:phospholipid transport system substrate-binding protein
VVSLSRIWLLWLLLLLPGWGTAAAEEPLEVVRQTADRMITELRAHRKELEADPRLIYGLVEKIVLPRFDFELISKYALGKNWRTATPEQRKAFTSNFRSLMVRTYAHTLLNYSDQEIRYLPVRGGGNDKRVVVATQVSAVGAAAIPIDYKLYAADGGGWQVYDVEIDGVSLVSTYRSNFDSQIRRVGVDGVIQWLVERNQDRAQ